MKAICNGVVVGGGGGEGVGAFSEREMFENVLYRSEDVPVLTMYHCG